MAMTPMDDAQPSAGQAALNDAAAALRVHVDPRWLEISDRVLQRALSVTRRSMPVRAAGSGGPVTVSEQVLVAYLRHAVASIRHVIPTAIRIQTDERGSYTGVVVQVTAQFGQRLLPLADEVRARATAVLRDILGPVTPPVTVDTMDVHIEDVASEH